MKALEGSTRTTFVCFFGLHIFFSILQDSQVIVPEFLIPTPLRQFNTWYSTTFNDPLMSNGRNLLWFQSLVICELIFQVPFFFVAVYYISNSTIKNYPAWFGPACMLYGGHTATTLVPILASLVTNENATFTERIILFHIYIPFFLLPLYIFYLAAADHIEMYDVISKKLKNT